MRDKLGKDIKNVVESYDLFSKLTQEDMLRSDDFLIGNEGGFITVIPACVGDIVEYNLGHCKR